MKITNEYGTISIETKHVTVYLNQDWSNILKPNKYNWNSFNLLKVYFEKDTKFYNAELEVCLLGFNSRLVWTYNLKGNKKAIKKLLSRDWRKD